MGSIISYDTNSGRRYGVKYRRPDRKQTMKRGFRTKREATLYLAQVEVDKSRGAYIDPSLTRATVAEWLDLWLTSRSDLRRTSRTRSEGIIRNHIVPALGAIPIGELTRLEVQRWASQLPGSPESVRKVVNVLSGALRLAVDDGRLPANPAHRLKLRRPVKRPHRYLTHEQVGALARTVGDKSEGRQSGYDTLVLVLAYCGLRWGELSGLRVRDVDLIRRRLSIEQTVVADKGIQRVEAPKDYEARSIPIPLFLLARIREQVAGKSPDAPVFAGQRGGGWLRNHVFRKGWLDEAAASIGAEGLTPHELRHTAASLAVSVGANVKAVQRMLGHASAAVTLDVYADLFDDDLDEVAVRLDEAALRAGVVKVVSHGDSVAA